uniref:3-hydroxyacyl-CoA dehydrogenase n=1 Tax=Polytomella parva TaxID=51329 RepID=A0A7S0UTE4_9CHLO|mmetsp:Transcript_16115/g.29013  ORF Transcript_16115/g.29013 Transcript_16115/m.29013 type:complete len:748 (+) Transcript_16115:163-2406(+)|eukprot:CAMPEP_0175060084 /NCGR_PEP_ID=MMETSP0052_2-20121109/12799_1 /TAXON_ID=51329 ORGANISM="Polytomella parva, Strain SAG 63-3" /NCGR_SAMPLE_ID=MMETSP0052_2 /ASSEMBLY_ACC=CAM_ASM_000194 /LENGTH=747 /DNA_ID=CAMNT_0016325721 /DNA_START=51 /DNA_END=2294 /DNA_ORIENTATION=-
MSSPVAEYRVENGVAIITLKNPPMNALHPKLLQSLFSVSRQAQEDPTAKAIVVIGSGKYFCAGFDISQFQNASSGDAVDTDEIHANFGSFLEAGPKPSVAAVRGVALGGGLEVAMACNARVATAATKLGLPELTLGVLPGFGGTQRLPRLVGVRKSVQMIMTSTPIGAVEGLKFGLVDAVAEDKDLLETAKKMALDIAELRKPKMNSLTRTDKLEPFAVAQEIIRLARLDISRRMPGLAHPHLCLDSILEGISAGGAAGLKRETAAFSEAQRLLAHKALVHLFFAQRATKKVKGISDGKVKPRSLKTVAVIGGGLMGSGIITALILNGYDVVLKEIQKPFLDAGMGRIKANLDSRVKKGAMKQAAADAALRRVTGTLSYDPALFQKVDMVIEAALEDLVLKQKVFADLEKVTRPDCILASNTSTIDIEKIGGLLAGGDAAQQRLVGAHFFSPAHIMPLLEVVRTTKTSAQVLVDTIDLGAKIKKTPVVVGNCCGFAVNRVFFPYTMAATMLVDMGIDPYRIDKAVAAFGMPMGPFRLCDLVGADISLHVGHNCAAAFPERVYDSRLLTLLNEAKRLGEKTGSGFYAFTADKTGKRKAVPAGKDLVPFVTQSRSAASAILAPAAAAAAAKLTDQDIVDFIFFPVVNEGCRVIAEGVVDKAADLDVCTVMAMGFPQPKGGLIFWADNAVGAGKVRARLDEFARLVGPKAQGFFEPCSLLKAAAEKNVTISSAMDKGVLACGQCGSCSKL